MMNKTLLSTLDIAIIVIYLGLLIFIGFYLKRRASRNLESYLLGGKSIPWYMLGLSNASGMFDISGTVWLVAITVIYGLKSIYIPWLWPVFNQIFLMVYLSAWLRRSGVTTGAEWIGFRFGNDKGAVTSHWIIVVFAILVCLSMLAYGFIGIGKFIEIFLPLKTIFPSLSFIPDAYVPHVWGIVFTLFAAFYALMGGMMSIVWADVAQYAIMTLAAIAVAVIAMVHLDIIEFSSLVPEGWFSPAFGNHLALDWSGKLSEFNSKIQTDGYQLFSFFFGMVLMKGILASMAGPAPTYDMQKILSTKSPREASLMSGFVSVILLPVRYFMIAGFAVIGLIIFDQIKGQITVNGVVDFELVLPAVIAHEWIPAGLVGITLAGLLAAFMSTFAGTLNAAQAYLVNDIYIKYLKPDATSKQSNRTSIIVGVVVVIISILFGVVAENVNSILQWVTGALYGSYIAANILKWHWWRFNSNGFAWGMIGGLIPALILPYVPVVNTILPLYYFPVILVFSVIGCIWGTYAAPATDTAVLKQFYAKTRPWGFWKPVHDMVVAEQPDFQKNKAFGRDMLNVTVGIIWQTALVAAPIYLVVKQVSSFVIALVIVGIGSVVLKKNWYDKLEE
ncbi:sodium:solute symporter family protein [uncultured Proteiniphilum sp.]|uniref:sodium:solute symporter family protein n=1 Tax=uncultured Proteiniphilum sp. TaxID=497637 RepID=UPI00262BE5ED|nr:sodium:solute symporter family protein [uncultured Proteiniphilum sp.]